MEVTDDFKIATNRAIVSLKDKNQEMFVASIKYILNEIQFIEYNDFAEYLYRKLESEE